MWGLSGGRLWEPKMRGGEPGEVHEKLKFTH